MGNESDIFLASSVGNLGMMLTGVPDDLTRKMGVSNGQGKPINEVFQQAVRAHSLNCSLKETVDFHERTVIKKDGTEKAEELGEPSIDMHAYHKEGATG